MGLADAFGAGRILGGHSMASGGGDRKKQRERILSKNIRKSDHYVRFNLSTIWTSGKRIHTDGHQNVLAIQWRDRVTVSVATSDRKNRKNTATTAQILLSPPDPHQRRYVFDGTRGKPVHSTCTLYNLN